MTHAIRMHEHGGPEVLRWEAVEVGEPGPGEIRVRNRAVGINFIEIYQRRGLYPMSLPSGMGSEAAGVVEAVGPGVTSVAPGDRVAYSGGPPGAYAEARLMPAANVIRVPDGIDDQTAAAVMLKGLTTWYLLRRTRLARAGETVLIHAAAGGVGLIFCQWARALGLTVIGTVGSPEKAELARAHGCDHTIDYRHEDVARRVRELTSGAGVPVVYDSVGKDTFAGSIECLAPLGMMVLFGQSSGPVPPVDLRLLAASSLFLTRPTLRHYIAERAEFEAGTSELFGHLMSGAIKTRIDRTFPLRDAAEAHRALESRATSGQLLLLP